MTDEYLTVAEIATVLKLNQQTIRNWIDAGKLPALHLGRRVRVKRSDFEQLLRDAELPHGEPKDGNGGSPSIWEGHIPMPEVPAVFGTGGSPGAHRDGGGAERGGDFSTLQTRKPSVSRRGAQGSIGEAAVVRGGPPPDRVDA